MRTEPLGIDISRYQMPINWDKFFSQPVKFVAVRATIGNSYIDPWFKSSYAAILDYDAPQTAYHVVRPDVDARSQVDWFLDAFEGGWYSNLPLVLDCELDKGYSAAHIAQVIYYCAHYLEDKTGHKPIIYSRTEWLNRCVGPKHWLNDYYHWVAIYGWLGNESPILPDDVKLPVHVDRERFIIHQTTDRLKGADFGATSKQIDGNRWVGVKSLDDYIDAFNQLDETEPLPVIPEYTDDEKLACLWQAHPELHRA